MLNDKETQSTRRFAGTVVILLISALLFGVFLLFNNSSAYKAKPGDIGTIQVFTKEFIEAEDPHIIIKLDKYENSKSKKEKEYLFTFKIDEKNKDKFINETNKQNTKYIEDILKQKYKKDNQPFNSDKKQSDIELLAIAKSLEGKKVKITDVPLNPYTYTIYDLEIVK